MFLHRIYIDPRSKEGRRDLAIHMSFIRPFAGLSRLPKKNVLKGNSYGGWNRRATAMAVPGY